jgi:hypothetical protein
MTSERMTVLRASRKRLGAANEDVRGDRDGVLARMREQWRLPFA